MTVLSLEKNLLFHQQSLSQQNRQIEEIENAYPKPRSKEIENELYAFEKARDETKLLVDKQRGKIAKLKERAKGLERELKDLKLEQIRV